MAKDSKIEWTHHTFNPWWGCAKVSPACTHCYAEAWAKRVGSSVWGKDAPRRFFGDAHWNDPVRWHREAVQQGVRRRVFCASMADVFERRAELHPWRERLWRLIETTPSLDWLLLTKFPRNCSPSNNEMSSSWTATVSPRLARVRPDARWTAAPGTNSPSNAMPDIKHYQGREQGYIKHALIE